MQRRVLIVLLQIVIRYRNLFDHFSDHCKPEGHQTFRWWCDTCVIPHYWLMGSDLVRHRQEIYDLTDADWPADLTFPHNFLSWRAVPATFDSSELLEHNVKFFGGKKHKDAWNEEVRLLREEDINRVVFTRPDRGEMSARKRLNADRVYGTKKRASKSKKVLKVTTIMENDGVTDIVMADANDVIVSEHDLNQSFSKDFVDDVIGVVVDKSKSVVVNKSESVVDDIIVVKVVAGVPDKPSDKELHPNCEETEYVKWLLGEQEVKFLKMLKAKDDKILELEQLLKAEKAASLKKIEAEKSASMAKVDESCRVAREGMNGMLGAYVGLHPTMVSTVIEQVQEVAAATFVKTSAEIREGHFFKSTMAKIDEAQSTKPDP